jgi:hypothetical protein
MLMLNPLNTELNPICHLLALLGGATIVVVSRLRVNLMRSSLIIVEHCLKKIEKYYIPENLKEQEKQQMPIYDTRYVFARVFVSNSLKFCA